MTEASMTLKSLKLRNNRILKYSSDGIPRVFGILNVTPDSFSDGGRFLDPDRAVCGALAMLDAGACGIDVGAESTRPGAEEVPVPVEIERLVPVIRALKEARSDAVISVDTRKAAVAAAALEAGADIVNDISAMTFDPEMASVVSGARAAVILMHMRGMPQTMQNPEYLLYPDVCAEVADYLDHAFERAVAAGISPDSILLDPGLGFAKTPEQNLALVRGASELRKKVKAPLYYAPSRKSFLARICKGKPASERDYATAGVLASLTVQGIEFVRVHNVSMALETMTAFQLCRPDSFF